MLTFIFVRLTWTPFLFTKRPKKTTLCTESTFLFISKQTMYPKDSKDKPQMVYVLMQAFVIDQDIIKVGNHKLSYALSKNMIH